MNPEQVRLQLEKLLASPEFSEAVRARRFLRFVVEQTLQGHAQAVKESVIATEVLGRNSSFDPRTDPIVRVEAGRLRSRLNTYYASLGKDDDIVISLPKGGYVPQFSAPQSSVRPNRKKLIFLLAFAGLFALAAGLSAFLYFSPRSTPLEQSLLLSLLPPGRGPIQACAISPDGRYIVFAADGALWIRPVDRQESRRLPGTNSASNPFWSPDSRSIAFFVPGKLKKVGVSGSPPQDICDADIGRGGSWGSDVIIFAPRPGGGLFRVNSNGGIPTPLTSPDVSHGEAGHAFPYFLPDGRRFLYSVVSRTTDSSVRAGSLEDPKGKFLVKAEPGAIYSSAFGSSAKLIFVYAGALLAQPINPATLELYGESSVITPSVRLGMDRANASASSTGVVTFEPGKIKDQQLTWFDREGKPLGTVGPRNSYFTWALAPDEKHVAIQDAVSGGESQPSLWILDIQRGSLSRIATHGAQSFSPIWSPDSSEVLFSDGTHAAMALIRQRLGSSIPVSVLESAGIKVPSDWSADGKFVAYFTSWPDFRRLSSWIAPVSASALDQPRIFSSANSNEFDATFSPLSTHDGPRWIAYCSNETGRREIYVRDFPRGLHKWIVSGGGGSTPHWRRDGHELFYLAPNGILMSVDVKDDAGQFAAGSPRPSFDTGVNSSATYRDLPVNTYAVSRDGRHILLNRTVESQPTSISVLVRR